MDNGTIALYIVLVLVGLGVFGALLSWLMSFYYYDHK